MRTRVSMRILTHTCARAHTHVHGHPHLWHQAQTTEGRGFSRISEQGRAWALDGSLDAHAASS